MVIIHLLTGMHVPNHGSQDMPGQFILRVTVNHRPENLEMTNDGNSAAIVFDRSGMIRIDLIKSYSFQAVSIRIRSRNLILLYPFVVGHELPRSCTA